VPALAFPVARWASWAWLAVRVYAGWSWLEAGWSKTASAAWFDAAAWSRSPLRPVVAAVGPNALANAIADGETLIGIAILLGVFTALAAFAGVAASFVAMLAGVANPPLLPLLAAAVLALGWRESGRIGFDRWLLPAIGFRRDVGPSREQTGDVDRPGSVPGAELETRGCGPKNRNEEERK
jgi:thiosulfate dehydrogenase [quinone] large subunit